MKIQYGLISDKSSVDIISYVDLGDVDVNYATHEDTEEISSPLIYLKFSVANFPTTNVSAVQLFSLSWKAVWICEKKCFLCVTVATCGASSSHRIFDMQHYFKNNVSTTAIIHKVKNSFASTRYLYFFSDPPPPLHFMKT